MKRLIQISCIVITIALSSASCHRAAGPKSAADSLNRDSAIRDVTQSDTEKVDTTKKGGGKMTGDGHPRGGLY